MMQSISHWGQFEMQAAGTENFKEALDPVGVAWSEFSPAPVSCGTPDVKDDPAFAAVYFKIGNDAPGPFVATAYDSKYLHGQQDYQLYFNEIPVKSGQ